MKRELSSNHSRKGQNLVIVAMSMVVLIAMSALLLDGGFTYMDRRKAQASADAGALAGAYELCAGDGAATAPGVAINYATTENEADAATAEIVNGIIIVNTTLSHASFFAQVFGIPQVDVSAVAAAGCFPPGLAESLLPIAWNCRPPVDGMGSPSDDCEIKSFDWVTQFEPLVNGDPLPFDIYGDLSWEIPGPEPFDFNSEMLSEIYVIMDAVSSADDVTTQCYEDPGNLAGELQCDLDGDGEIDILGNGGRSWLDLDGDGDYCEDTNSEGSSELVHWIINGYCGQIPIHKWVPDQSGVANNVFNAVNARKGDVLLLPVFNQFCVHDPLDGTTSPDPPYLTCPDAAHLTFPTPEPPDTDTAYYLTGSTTYFHIVGFVHFYVACVDYPGFDGCPGHDQAVTNLVFADNMKTIEGYFIANYPVDNTTVGTGGVDTGVYIYSLTQ